MALSGPVSWQHEAKGVVNVVNCGTRIRSWSSHCTIIVVAGLVGGWAMRAPAQDFVSDDWHFQATPYVWALSQKGDVTVKGRKTDVDVGFTDILTKLNAAVMAEAEARKGRFGWYVQGIYAKLSDDEEVGSIKLRGDVTTVWLGAGGFYRLGPWNLDSKAGAAGPKVVVDPYAGARYTYLDARVKIRQGGPQGQGDKHWIDPLVGLRTIWQLSPNWTVTALGDVGGFGVGSDLAWQAAGLVGYRFGLFRDNDARFMAGYKALHQDYSDGNGTNKFEWDMTLHGPVLGLAIDF
jgi:hypothetical protein